MEQTEANDIRYESERPYQDYELGIGYLWDPMSVKEIKQREARTWCAKETLQCLEGYGEAKGQKKNAIDEGRKNLCSMPTVRVSSSGS